MAFGFLKKLLGKSTPKPPRAEAPGFLSNLLWRKPPKARAPEQPKKKDPSFLESLLESKRASFQPRPKPGEWDIPTAEKVLPATVLPDEEGFLYTGDRIDLASSNVEFIQYAYDARALTVGFLNGSVYVYSDVPPEVATGMYLTESPGRYVWRKLRDQYPYRKTQPATIKRPKARVLRPYTPAELAAGK